MARWVAATWIGIAAALLLACVPTSPNTSQVEAQRPSGPKRLTAAINGDPKTLDPEAGTFARPLRALLHAGLANLDERGQLRPQIAEAVPNLDNGLWTLLPDGRMATTWKIRADARWHDGTPFTSNDILFTAQVAQDRGLPAFRDAAYQAVESVVAVDTLTVVVTWKERYINADQLFGYPLPRHLLEAEARDDKPNFMQQPYWSREFTGTGPFQLREWVAGESVLVDANVAYVLGRPHIDEIEVRIIPSGSTLVANLLAGAVEFPLGQTLSLDQALEVRGRWQQGRVEVVPRPGWTVVFPQLTYTSPPVVADVRFRRALLHAIDRQELVDTLMFGLSSVGDSILSIGPPEYADIRARAPRYLYDPGRAAQLVDELGYARLSDGGWRDSAGQRLSVEIRTGSDNDNNIKALQSVVNYWQRLGIGVDQVLVPPQQTDREYRATFPGFALNRNTADESWLVNFTSARIPTRDNNWTGNNPAGHRDPDYDALYERYSRTIPVKERIELAGQLAHLLADQAVAMGLYYDNLVAFIGNRLSNVVVSQSYSTQFAWSAHLWELRD
jgi:peptide/nickel transport system substrate-binding protein